MIAGDELSKPHLTSIAGLFGAICLGLSGCAKSAPPDKQPGGASPHALVVTRPVPFVRVEDAALWVHPTDPNLSLFFVANKTRGLEVHRMDGALLKHLEDGVEFDGVDVDDNFPLPGGPVDLVIAEHQGGNDQGLRVFRVDVAKLKLRDITAHANLPILDNEPGIGLCCYHSLKTGKHFVFVSSAQGAIEQYELSATADGKVDARKVRQFQVDGKVKALVADDEAGVVYVGEEKHGIWSVAAEPAASTAATQIIRTGENGLEPDVTGIALYNAAGGRGYLIVLGQGHKGDASQLFIYDRQLDHKFLAAVTPSSETFGAPSGSSGIVVSNCPAGAMFPNGVLALKDRDNASGVEDYLLYSWRDIAGPANLLIDTHTLPRRASAASTRPANASTSPTTMPASGVTQSPN